MSSFSVDLTVENCVDQLSYWKISNRTFWRTKYPMFASKSLFEKSKLRGFSVTQTFVLIFFIYKVIEPEKHDKKIGLPFLQCHYFN